MNYEQLILGTPAYLSGGLVSGATTLCIQSGALWPNDSSGTFRVLIDKEIKRLQGAASGSLTYTIVQGGAEGTTEASHNDQAAVLHIMTPQGIKNLAGAVNYQKGTSYTVGGADRAAMVTLDNASGVSVTLPQPSTSDTATFGPHFYTLLFNLQGSGAITPTAALINSGASLNLASGQWAAVYTDGTNYNAAVGGGATGTSLTSGSVQSGHIASGAVQGFFGPTRNIASGTVGVFDLGSGAVIAGTVGSGAVTSGSIASGQVGTNAIASGAAVTYARGVVLIGSGVF